MPTTANNNDFVIHNQQEEFLKSKHLFLNLTYHNILFCDDEKSTLDEKMLAKHKQLENTWINREKQNCMKKFDLNQPIKNIHIIEEKMKNHPAYNHKLFDFLNHDASLTHLKKFILNDAILNMEFFDYLALSVVGSSQQTKSEITANLWDEAGRGNIKYSHTHLFLNLMNDLGLNYNREEIIKTMTWEALAGINLFSYLSLYSFNNIKFFGLMTATEMMDPFHYNKLIKGILRLLPNTSIDISYYTEHEKIDIEHGQGWMKRVIIPELTRKPHKTQEFWLGFYMRLESMKKYYDRLLSMFCKKMAA